MGLENLFQGLQMFQQGLKEYSTSRAIGQATDAVNQLNQSELTDQQKRVAHMQLANQLALHLGQLGAPVSQIQSATGAIKPQQFGSAQEMMMEGYLTGNQGLTKQGQELASMMEQPKVAAEERAYKRQLGLQDRQYQQQLQLEMLKAGMKGKEGRVTIPGFEQVDPNVKLSDTEVKDFRMANSTAAALAKSAKRLEALVEESGTEWFPSISTSGRKMKGEYDGLMFQLKEFEKLGVLQKIDLEQLQKVLPDPTSFGSRTGAWGDYMQQFKIQLKDRIESSAAARGFKPTAAFMQRLGLEEAAPAGSGLQPGERLEQRTNQRTGETKTFVIDAKGNMRLWTGAD